MLYVQPDMQWYYVVSCMNSCLLMHNGINVLHFFVPCLFCIHYKYVIVTNTQRQQILMIAGMNVVFGIQSETLTVQKAESVSLTVCSIDV